MSATKFVALPYVSAACPANPIFPTVENLYRPIIDVRLQYKGQEADFVFPCLVDSGADFCVFPAQFGEQMGINIKAGKAFDTSGIGGKASLHFHKIGVGLIFPTLVKYFQCLAGFTYQREGTGVLGRKGFFELFDCVTFREKQSMFELYTQ